MIPAFKEFFDKLNEGQPCKYLFDEDSGKWEKSCMGISSIYESVDVVDITYIVVCHACSRWLQLSYPVLFDNLEKYHPLKEFWKGALLDFYDDLIFKDDEDKKIIDKLIHLRKLDKKGLYIRFSGSYSTTS